MWPGGPSWTTINGYSSAAKNCLHPGMKEAIWNSATGQSHQNVNSPLSNRDNSLQCDSRSCEILSS